MDLYYQPNGASFSGVQPMKKVEKLSYLNSIENCYRYGGDKAIGPYYPVRPLPSMEIDLDSEYPIVMPAGTIVSVIPLKDAKAYSASDAETGILAGGEIYVTVGVDGVAYTRSINLLYPGETAGLITICNGGDQVTVNYSDDDGTYGILTASGEVATASHSYTRSANIPLGIVNHRVYADMRLRYLNYEVGQSPVSIALGGVLTIPCAIVYGGNSGDRSTVVTAIENAVRSKHQYYISSENNASDAQAAIAVGTPLKSNRFGKFTRFISGTHAEVQRFGQVIGTRNRVPYDLDEIIDSFPGSGMKGTDTGGLSARYYHFAKTILALPAVKGSSYAASKDNIKATLYAPVATNTGSVSILFGQVDVAFGKINY